MATIIDTSIVFKRDLLFHRPASANERRGPVLAGSSATRRAEIEFVPAGTNVHCARGGGITCRPQRERDAKHESFA
jgi:hypothetical protein